MSMQVELFKDPVCKSYVVRFYHDESFLRHFHGDFGLIFISLDVRKGPLRRSSAGFFIKAVFISGSGFACVMGKINPGVFVLV